MTRQIGFLDRDIDKIFSTIISIDKKRFPLKVKYHSKKTVMKFEYPDYVQHYIRIYRNLDNSVFCKKFFMMNNILTDTNDVRNEFGGFTPFAYEIGLVSSFVETVQINDDTNKLSITGFTLPNLEDDILFIYIIRNVSNSLVLGDNIVRSAGIEITTDIGRDYLNNLYENSGDK